jgi:hypothetical protein
MGLGVRLALSLTLLLEALAHIRLALLLNHAPALVAELDFSRVTECVAAAPIKLSALLVLFSCGILLHPILDFFFFFF